MKNIIDEKTNIAFKLAKYESHEDKIKYLNKEIKKNEKLLKTFCNTLEYKNHPYKNGTIAMGNGFSFLEEEYYNGIIEHLKERKLSIVSNLPPPETVKVLKDKITNKQQILLLNYLGILENEHLQKLTTEKKGILLGYLLNRDEKNMSDYIRYFYGKPDNKFNCKTPANIEAVNKILKILGLKEILT